MNPFRVLVPAAVFLLLAGCSQHTPEATIDVIDTSSSITPRAEKAALEAVRAQIAHMQRGDTLVAIPITGDSSNDAGGHVLRLSAPTQRETYDDDLRRFREQAQKQLVTWAASLEPYQSRTDILGALDAAGQELRFLPQGRNRRLIVVSDFLEDDGAFRFVSARPLADPAQARQLADHLRRQHGFALRGVTLCLGRLESTDFAPLSVERKEAVDAFWTEYFTGEIKSGEIQFDGTGLLADPQRDCIWENR
jgi:hypothetical protein